MYGLTTKFNANWWILERLFASLTRTKGSVFGLGSVIQLTFELGIKLDSKKLKFNVPSCHFSQKTLSYSKDL